MAMVILTIATPTAQSASLGYATDPIRDLALIYQGGTQRPYWTQSDFVPYVTHRFADGHIDWLFDGYLFLEYTNNWKVAFENGKGNGSSATKTDWIWLLGRIFQQDRALDAMDKCIEKYKDTIGDPGGKRKIVMGLPSPIKGQTNWGEIDGESLNFNIRADQVKAVHWYIDQLKAKFDSAQYKNIELTGFYWIDEDTIGCGNLPAQVSSYIKDMGLRFYWIPYWNARGYDGWQSLGFNTAYQQPNYFFDTKIIISRLRDACRSAKLLGMGLEFEFDYRALYESTNSFYSRMEDYLNAFEENGVFDNSAIAWYSGTKAILQMYESAAPENLAIMDRLAQHVVDRRNKAGIKAINIDNSSLPTAIGGNGEIRIIGDNNTNKVYTISGQLISHGLNEVHCAPGIYIVKSNGKVTKVIVR
jgi:hypothetical protein